MPILVGAFKCFVVKGRANEQTKTSDPPSLLPLRDGLTHSTTVITTWLNDTLGGGGREGTRLISYLKIYKF